MVFGESATYEGCPLARVIHWKNRRLQYRGSYRLNKSQLAYKSISQPHLLYFTSVVASQVVGFVSLWQEHLGTGMCSLVAIRGLCGRTDARLVMSGTEGLGESNVCEGNTCGVMPLFLQICSSLFLWKGGCKLNAKWKPEVVVFGAHLAVPLDNFK